MWKVNPTPFYMVLNASSSIAIVLINKQVFSVYDFTFGTTLTFIHFVLTFIGLQICAWTNLFTPKRVDIRKVLPLSASFCGFVVLTNISLSLNSVGFYQLAKVMTTPCIVFIQSVFYGEKLEWKKKASLVPILVGVCLNSVYDVQLNFLGTVYAAAAVVVTSLYQVWVGQRQKDLGLNSMQLLYYQAPLSAAMLIFVIPVLDDYKALLNYSYTPLSAGTILFSGVVAFMVNLSIFLVIGKTSPVTYNVLGHFKLCVILLGGWLCFNETLSQWQSVGVAMTLAGVFYYTHLSLAKDKNTLPVTNSRTTSTLRRV
eukprot:Colp12_sorted_trinity150504_noHs@7620